MVAHKEFLRIESPVGRFNPCAYGIVAGRKKRCSDAQRGCHLCRRVTQSVSGTQQFGTRDVRCQIAVAELEPMRHSITLHLFQAAECFLLKAPTPLRIEPSRKAVDDGIDIGTDM